MKKVMAVAMLAAFSFAATAQEVGGDRKLSADFENYKTYAWVTDIDNIPQDKMFVGPEGVLIFNNNSSRASIKEAVQYELSARGYTMAEKDADLLVNFSVLEQSGRLRTYDGYQVLGMGGDTIRTEDNLEWTEVQPGTLLVNLIDRKTSELVWQGYASGILKQDMMRDKLKVREAVSSIFQEFNYKAATASK